MTRLQPFQVSREQVVQFGKPAKAVPTLQIGKQCAVRVTHLSHAARGLDEQPAVQEGYVARSLEKQGLVADRCELNRGIRADNKLLRELMAALLKLTAQREDAVAEFESVHSEIRPEDMPSVLDRRADLRSSHDDAIAALLQKHYGGAYHDLDRIKAASSADAAIGAQSGEIGMQAIRLEQERLHSLTVEPPQNKKKQNYEMSR